MNNQDIKDVQKKILEIMLFIDKICRENNIIYYIMGGTALGAVRHKGFIPWDDDLDIFMTPENYYKFKKVFENKENHKFVIQEWKTNNKYLEYAKVRMNGTTFIEKNFLKEKNLHQGIYVDIMILHKSPKNKNIQNKIYRNCKVVTFIGLCQRNWVPKNYKQKIAKIIFKIIPNKIISKKLYNIIYKYDNLNTDYVYFYYITKAKFNQGIFNREIFDSTKEIEFEGHKLLCPNHIEEYLKIRYGDYMKMPSIDERKMNVHAYIYDVNKDYTEYIN